MNSFIVAVIMHISVLYKKIILFLLIKNQERLQIYMIAIQSEKYFFKSDGLTLGTPEGTV